MKDKFFKLARGIPHKIRSQRQIHNIPALKDDKFNLALEQFSQIQEKTLKAIKAWNKIPDEILQDKEFLGISQSLNKDIDTSYNFFIKKLKGYLQQGEKHLSLNDLEPAKSMESFKKAVDIANLIIESRSHELSSQHKQLLAKAYSGYADVLHKFKISQIDTIENMLQKALELDPNNEKAIALSFEMNFYEISDMKKVPKL